MSPEISQITAAILAGGESRRFGSPKINAMIGGKRLIDIAIDVARKISDEILIIVGSQSIEPIENICSYQDIIPDCGPLGGIYTALYHSTRDWIAILPADMPRLIPQVYLDMMNVAEDEKPVAAVSTQGLEPLVSIWHKNSLNVLLQNIQKKNLDIRTSLSLLGFKAVLFNKSDSDAINPFININTLEDFNLVKSEK